MRYIRLYMTGGKRAGLTAEKLENAAIIAMHSPRHPEHFHDSHNGKTPMDVHIEDLKHELLGDKRKDWPLRTKQLQRSRDAYNNELEITNPNYFNIC